MIVGHLQVIVRTSIILAVIDGKKAVMIARKKVFILHR
ncbi:hypothetical protein SDC9_166251 [bioreactor metagenome]|uniref:Uncharacterized protein n=1 Tax=bioreactor metagenome TaxID=1076179 RepID=A0A645FYB2_9ZZZZ